MQAQIEWRDVEVAYTGHQIRSRHELRLEAKQTNFLLSLGLPLAFYWLCLCQQPSELVIDLEVAPNTSNTVLSG